MWMIFLGIIYIDRKMCLILIHICYFSHYPAVLGECGEYYHWTHIKRLFVRKCTRKILQLLPFGWNTISFLVFVALPLPLLIPSPLAHSKISNTSYEWNFVIWRFHVYVCMLRSFLESEWIYRRYRHVCLCSEENFVTKKLCNLEIVTLSAFFLTSTEYNKRLNLWAAQ